MTTSTLFGWIVFFNAVLAMKYLALALEYPDPKERKRHGYIAAIWFLGLVGWAVRGYLEAWSQ